MDTQEQRKVIFGVREMYAEALQSAKNLTPPEFKITFIVTSPDDEVMVLMSEEISREKLIDILQKNLNDDDVVRLGREERA